MISWTFFFFLSLLPQWVKQDGLDSGWAPKEDSLGRPEFACTGDSCASITSLLHCLRAYRLRELPTAPTTLPISSFTVQFPPWMFLHTTLLSALWLPSMHVRASYKQRDTLRLIYNRLTRPRQIRYEVWLLNKSETKKYIRENSHLVFYSFNICISYMAFCISEVGLLFLKGGLLFLFLTSMFGIPVCPPTSLISHSKISKDVYNIFILP